MRRIGFLVFGIIYLYGCSYSIPYADVVVAKDGSGDFRTITEAIDKLPSDINERVVVYIKNGVYNEKFRIKQDNITLLGESRDSTIIEYHQLRLDWINNKDDIGPAVINIHADDFILKNLTVRNTQPRMDEHAFTIYGEGTRTIFLNCTITSKGGDTVSLWDRKDGMYYHSDCHFEGAVDFVCPRGWCYIDNSTFFEVRKTATLWHAGAEDKNQKFVVKNSSFDGAEGFNLGRHHYEAQFYLINCSYSSTMIDKPIFYVTYPDNPSRNRPYVWGERKYFYGVKKEGKQFDWLKDNLDKADSITAAWTFDHRWNPEDDSAPSLVSSSLKGGKLVLEFSEEMTVRGELILTSEKGDTFTFETGRGSKALAFSANDATNLPAKLSIQSGQLLATKAYTTERKVSDLILL